MFVCFPMYVTAAGTEIVTPESRIKMAGQENVAAFHRILPDNAAFVQTFSTTLSIFHHSTPSVLLCCH